MPMKMTQRMKMAIMLAALEDVELWLYDAQPDTAGGELLETVRLAIQTAKE